ncbi:MAG: PLP-dependent cysteine synthase family protein [Hyphomonadaceae bacterium]|nr:MAG: cysteine synthase A [Caulobacteraceae bacterium]MBT9446318.1 PLP-dependent cysteine synthase family protein [Hyphomonadaceae bacterium]TPW07996.1 MAG: cysteine synthase A [Alphaproteobacteria bacterium]
MLSGTPDRNWICAAIGKIEADFNRSADTHLLRLDLPSHGGASGGADIYLKDESTHPSGSLKHRLARSLMLYGICSGWVREGAPVIEASSGSTAISEAYFARLLGLPFIAVAPKTTAAKKLEEIGFLGGRVHLVDDASRIYAEAQALADSLGGHYLDQFTHAERATDWRGNNNIAESIFAQMKREPHATPRWIVVGAGTGGTSATIGRFIRYNPCYAQRTRLCVVDPENSAFFDHYATGAVPGCLAPGRIEGIGRPRVEPSFLAGVVDRMLRVPDAASIAATRWLSRHLGRKVGPSTGTNLIGVLKLAGEMRAAGETGSIVSLLCDPGERYADTIFDDAWIARQGLDLAPWTARLDACAETGVFDAQLDSATR